MPHRQPHPLAREFVGSARHDRAPRRRGGKRVIDLTTTEGRAQLDADRLMPRSSLSEKAEAAAQAKAVFEKKEDKPKGVAQRAKGVPPPPADMLRGLLGHAAAMDRHHPHAALSEAAGPYLDAIREMIGRLDAIVADAEFAMMGRGSS